MSTRTIEGLYVARFKHTPGRYLVDENLGGQKIVGGPDSAAGRRQWERYNNPPDRETGFWLNEMYRTFSRYEVLSIVPAPSLPLSSYAARVLGVPAVPAAGEQQEMGL